MRIQWIVYCLLLVGLSSLIGFANDGGKDASLSLEIIDPANGQSTEWRTKVTGKVSKPLAEVWVVVRPLETRDFWVQPKTTVQTNGEWEAMIYLGGKGKSHIGKVFDIRAIANPVDTLKEGLVFPGWPRAEAKSDLIRVARR